MPSFTFPDLTLDGLLRLAAARDPGGPALSTEEGTVTFAGLDRRADRIARYLTGRAGAAVAVANVLDPVFPAAYYGAGRAGCTVVLVNPLLRDAGLRHVCGSAGAEIAFVPGETAQLLAKLRESLPALHSIIVTDAADGVVPEGTIPLDVALSWVPDRPEPVTCGADPASVACVQFTTGTTGSPKGVRLTHRNLVANAAQIAAAHGLRPGYVTLNHLPLYHVMHLNSAVYAGAEQVLCRDPDPVASLALAARARATHYYGLPARLHRLAADERLDAPGEGVPAAPSLIAVLSGGTALAPAAARRLSDALGVPVIQGYGLAELSPLSHSRRPTTASSADSGRRGCVGPPVPGTECRIVTLDEREPAATGTAGEVQVRGPQLMAGYLGDDGGSAAIDADGWFSTGDVGYVDDDGVLFLVDRLGDVFKHDNDLVSPTAVEQTLLDDPRVADCVVTGLRDPVHGSVCWAGVVLADWPAPPGFGERDVLDAIAATANGQLAHFERIHRIEALDAVPRTPVGKPARRALGRRLHTRADAGGSTW